MYKISVIIPTWNRSHTIERAINSVLNQTFPPHEILICDDGSNDNTEAVVKFIPDRRIQWLSGEHTGLPAVPRNRGIQNSQGEWLAFLDSDDEWIPNKLEKQLQLVHRLNCKAVSTNAYHCSPHQEVVGNLITWNKATIHFEDLIKNNWIITSSVMVHRSLIGYVQGFPEDMLLKALEDYSLWLRIATQTFFGYLDEPLIIYHDDIKNSIRKESLSHWKQRQYIFKNYLKWLNKQNSIIKQKYILQAYKAYQQSSWQIQKQQAKKIIKLAQKFCLTLLKTSK